ATTTTPAAPAPSWPESTPTPASPRRPGSSPTSPSGRSPPRRATPRTSTSRSPTRRPEHLLPAARADVDARQRRRQPLLALEPDEVHEHAVQPRPLDGPAAGERPPAARALEGQLGLREVVAAPDLVVGAGDVEAVAIEAAVGAQRGLELLEDPRRR